MARFVDWNKWIQSQQMSNIEEVKSSFELLAWRKQSSSSLTARYLSKNQNAIGRHHSQNEDISLSNQREHQQLLNTSSPSTNFTTNNPVELRINANNKPEKIDSHLSQKSVTITRRSSKPSRHESVQIATSQTRQRQHDRYINYHHRLKENQLYSLIVSSNGVECYGTNCQPSVFNASHRCQTISSENDLDAIKNSPLMDDQAIKQNPSYISLTNLSNIIDHEPNVSRRDSYSQSTSNVLMHKPSLFLANIFNKMTHEQRGKSIAQLVKFHENLSKSNTTIDKLQRTTSLPNFDNKPTKLHSITSLSSERTTANIIQLDNKTSSTSPTEQIYIDEDRISEHVNLDTSNNKCTTDLNEETTSTFTDQKVYTSIHVSELPDGQILSSPVKLVSLPSLDPLSEHKLSQENMHTNNPSVTTSTISPPIVHPSMAKLSSIFIKSTKSNTSTGSGKTKISRSNHFLDVDLHEESSTIKLKPSKRSKLEQIDTQSSKLSNSTEVKTIASSSNSIMNLTPIKKQQSDNETRPETNLENNDNLFSKEKIQKSHSKNDINQPSKAFSSSNKPIDHPSQSKILSPSIINKEKQMPSSSSHFQSSNDENEIENSLNDVTDHLSQQDIIISNTNLDKSFNTPSKESNKPKQTLSLLKTIDEISQHSKSSHSHLKNSTSLITSPAISTVNEPLSITPTKPEIAPLSPIDDGDTSIITRTTTASTNLTITNDDDDEQSKLINEQLKRSSLGLARDSLELLRNATPHYISSDEQLIPHTNIDSTPQKRKSVLKSRLDSSDSLPTPELISYIAIDEVKGDKYLMEKQMRRHSLTVGGGTIVSCTSPKPKRDSLILLQERYSGSMSPHSGYYHLSNSDSRHVEFIREPGDTITPVLHIGRGIKSKHPSSKPLSPSSSSDHFHPQHHFSSHTFDSSERTKSEMSVMGDQQRFETETDSQHPSLDSVSRHRTTLTTTSFINTDDIEEESLQICFNKSDYDEMVRLLTTPLPKKNKKYPIKSTFESNMELCMNNRLTIFKNLILLILVIFFYIFIFIKSQYWQEYHQQ